MVQRLLVPLLVGLMVVARARAQGESVHVEPAPAEAPPVAVPEPPGAPQLALVRKAYEEARNKVGGEHVLLTAMAYAGRERSQGRWEATRGGVAAVISLPIFGAGNGHGGDWYPVLQTEDATKAFARFQAQLELYTRTLESADSVEARSEGALQVLRDAASTLLDQVSEDDPSTWELARSVRGCVQSLHGTSSPPDEPTIRLRTRDVLTGRRIYRLRGSKRRSIVEGVDALSDACVRMVKEVGSKSGVERVRAETQAIRSLLQQYWQRMPVDQQVPKRHWLLFGPALGIPVTQDPTDLVLLGGHAEVGTNRYFRLGLVGGAQVRYAKLARTPGWFAGLALSGALGDQLVHWINGGLTAARKLQALP